MQRTNIYLEVEHIAALDEVAAARGVSRAEVVRDLIDRGLSARQASLDGDLAAIEASFGVLGDDLALPDRASDERDRHLDRIRAS